MAFKQIFRTAVTDKWTTASDGDPIGDLRWENNKCYKCIVYAEGVAAVDGVAGEVAEYVIDTGYAANTVSSDYAGSGTSIGAGVLQAALADGEFGWIQIKGAATLTIALTAGADGNALTLNGAGDGTLDLVDTDVALADNGCAYCIDASAKEILCDFPW